jgi:hypothetical protein
MGAVRLCAFREDQQLREEGLLLDLLLAGDDLIDDGFALLFRSRPSDVNALQAVD